MSDLVKALNTMATDADWQRMAVHAGMPARELKEHVTQAIEREFGRGATTSSVPEGHLAALSLGDALKRGDCETKDFEASLFKIIGIKGSLELCGDSSDWSAALKVSLIVAGASVWTTTYRFDPHNLSVCFNPSVGMAKANLCFTLQTSSDKVCLNIKGDACVWAFGWHCGKFDTTLFCIPLPK